jgi:hypothetical protein
MSRILFTKDGRRTGNAIVIKEIQPSSVSMKAHLAKDNQKLYLVETDFGNRMKLSTNEINEMFDPGPKQSYKKWASDRAELREEVKIADQEPPVGFILVPLAFAMETAEKFRFYQSQHEANGTPESKAKAQVNKDLADRWEAQIC